MAIPTTHLTEATETPAEPAPPPVTPRSHGYCSWHEGYAWGVRPVREWDEGSGPAQRGLFACPPCRLALDLVPLGDQV
ncbi:hypothetical protein [Streptomyces ossamyceticus]|uniref:hypothetical protein n=1 Tax=Streptomyces ossamyceticus TaxID=249581 RepID=UPI000AAB5D91|nr:hypothetical protein [Streptomyces ossamyceticus]